MASKNSLEVVAFDTHQSGELFVLRAFDSSGSEVGSLERQRGFVGSPAEDGTGSLAMGYEFTFRVKDVSSTTLTYDLARTDLYPSRVGEIQQLLEIAEIRRALSAERIFVKTPGVTQETAFATGSCPTGTLLSPTTGSNPTPVAGQCCYDETVWCLWNYDDWQCGPQAPRELFVPDRGNNQGKLVERAQNIYGYGCRKSNGYTACTSGLSTAQGGDCYFGPNTWAIVSVTSPPSGSWRTFSDWYPAGWFNDQRCASTTSSGSAQFSNVTGTGSPGICAGGGSSSSIGWQGEY